MTKKNQKSQRLYISGAELQFPLFYGSASSQSKQQLAAANLQSKYDSSRCHRQLNQQLLALTKTCYSLLKPYGKNCSLRFDSVISNIQNRFAHPPPDERSGLYFCAAPFCTRDIRFVCPSMKRDPSSVPPPEDSSI